MSMNPYVAPSEAHVDAADSPPSRADLAAAIRSFLNAETTAFEFDERLDAFYDSDDPVVECVVRAVWFHYDDDVDHKVSLSKSEWDYAQRLLLLLESDCRIETTSRRIWSIRQLFAILALLSFVRVATTVGWGSHLLIFSVPFGLISMLLAYLPGRTESVGDSENDIILPFATVSDLKAAYRDSSFRKEPFPPAVSHRPVRSAFMNAFHQAYFHVIWLLVSPIPLFFQAWPRREVICRAHRNEPLS